MGDQRHAEDLRGEVVHLLQGLRHLDAAALAAAAGVDLRLDDPDLAAELARRGIRLGHRKAGTPRGVATPYLRRISLP